MEESTASRAAEWLLTEHQAGHHFKTLDRPPHPSVFPMPTISRTGMWRFCAAKAESRQVIKSG